MYPFFSSTRSILPRGGSGCVSGYDIFAGHSFFEALRMRKVLLLGEMALCLYNVSRSGDLEHLALLGKRFVSRTLAMHSEFE